MTQQTKEEFLLYQSNRKKEVGAKLRELHQQIHTLQQEEAELDANLYNFCYDTIDAAKEHIQEFLEERSHDTNNWPDDYDTWCTVNMKQQYLVNDVKYQCDGVFEYRSYEDDNGMYVWYVNDHSFTHTVVV